MEQRIDEYLDSWKKFRSYCEKKAKDRCILTNKNWLKLREYHLNSFLSTLDHPFGFLFYIRYQKPSLFSEIHCISSYYHVYMVERQDIEAPRTIYTFSDYKNSLKSDS